MFVTVKDLTRLIDNNIKYLNEAYETKENHTEEVFENYVRKMSNKLQNEFDKLCEISSNRRLIKSYREKIDIAIKQK